MEIPYDELRPMKVLHRYFAKAGASVVNDKKASQKKPGDIFSLSGDILMPAAKPDALDKGPCRDFQVKACSSESRHTCHAESRAAAA
jgi:glutamate dehydrogenase/leucine dehydrogenase